MGAPRKPRKRFVKVTPKLKRRFIDAVRHVGVQQKACELSGMYRRTLDHHKKKDPEFRRAIEEAREAWVDDMVIEAHRRALKGVERPLVSKGEIVWHWVDPETGCPVPAGTEGAQYQPLTIREYSDSLLMFLTKKERPEYREHPPLHASGLQVTIVTNLSEPQTAPGRYTIEVPDAGAEAIEDKSGG